ncbi:hypothetical protein A0J61_05243 [Choanephora cucurbitarum]|uniref:Uncharacterized protein n=1 Tax=Choanephora cucurbitarum TaxID=101091 RepID=A0A1C7ND74_9FUNG|nr:hypothetical protein A0J61_05243 [Choanephora cucurbitarum]
MAEPIPGSQSNSEKTEDLSIDFEALFNFPRCPTTIPQINKNTFPKGYSIKSNNRPDCRSILKSKTKTKYDFEAKEIPRNHLKFNEQTKIFSSSHTVLNSSRLMNQSTEYTESKLKAATRLRCEKRSMPIITNKERNGTLLASDFIVENELRAARIRGGVHVKELPLVKQSFLGIDLEELLLMQPQPSIPLRTSKSSPSSLLRNKLHKAISRMKKSHSLGDIRKTNMSSDTLINCTTLPLHRKWSPFVTSSESLQIVDCSTLLPKPYTSGRRIVI